MLGICLPLLLFACLPGFSQTCSLQDDGTTTVVCNDDQTYEVCFNVSGLNGFFSVIDNTNNAVTVTPTAFVLGFIVGSQSICVTYPYGTAYDVTIAGDFVLSDVNIPCTEQLNLTGPGLSALSAGCTDPLACNYDPAAICDDNSCLTAPTCNSDICVGDVQVIDPADPCACLLVQSQVLGCMDITACNFDPNANCDDNSCQLAACTDPCAPNYDSAAICDDNSCLPYNTTCNTDCTSGDLEVWDTNTCSCQVQTIVLQGCTDPTACNFDPNANCDDNSCIFQTACDDDPCTNGGTFAWDINTCSCQLNIPTIPGCNDNTACNFNPTANCDDNSCILQTACDDDPCTNGGTFAWDINTCSCQLNIPTIPGCNDNTACNFNPIANCDDNSCILQTACDDDPCTNGGTFAWDINTCSCILDVPTSAGCTNSTACNYDPAAICDDNSCIFQTACDDDPCTNGGIFVWNPATCACQLNIPSIPGCNDNTACNFNPTANCDDNSCIFQTACDDDPCTNGGVFVWDNVTCSCQLNIPTIPGCPDASACNFNPIANCDDNSCIFQTACDDDPCTNGGTFAWDINTCACQLNIPSIPGCTDNTACNFDPTANCDDNSCLTVPVCNNDVCLGDTEIIDPNDPCQCILNQVQVLGCTDQTACNFDPTANCNDGSCILQATCNTDICAGDTEIVDPNDLCACILDVAQVLGCTDLTACNYDPNANCDDNSCLTAPTCNTDICAGDTEIVDPNDPCLCILDVTQVLGCTDNTACNFDPAANCDDNSCLTIPVCNNDVCLGDTEIIDPNDPCQCILNQVQVLGCTDQTACNFDPTANCNDGSCLPIPNCNTDICSGDVTIVDPNDPCACILDIEQVLGCTNPNACNFDDTANCDDGSCLPTTTCNTDICSGDVTIVDPNDPCVCIIDIVQVLGCTDPNACNFDDTANCDDGSCLTNQTVCDDNDCNTEDSFDDAICDCVHEQIPTPDCDDGNCTTVDSYDDVNCICIYNLIPTPTCDDNNCNTEDSYDNVNCICINEPIPTPDCDDDDCTTYDYYNDNSCQCQYLTILLPSCNDNDCNTNDYYDTDICECVYDPIPTPDCDDNDCTTEDSYDPNTCSCVNDPIDCDDNDCNTADSYDTTICECVYDPIPPPDCDDNDCTTSDFYNPNNCECVYITIVLPICDDNDCNTNDYYDTDICECVNEQIEPLECNQDCTLGDLEVFNSATCECEIATTVVQGCIDPQADNYNPAANCDDGSCFYIFDPCFCGNPDNVIVGQVTYFAEVVTINAPTGQTWTVDFANSTGILDANGNPIAGVFTFTEVTPGVYELAFYHIESVGYSLTASNGTATGTASNSCDPCGLDGCTDATACNYDATATVDDGSCLPIPNCNSDICVGDVLIIDPTNACKCIVAEVQVLGCDDPAACNYDAAVNCDDGSCTYPANGCDCNDCANDTQAPIVSLNPDANWPDGFDAASFVSGQTIFYECGVLPNLNSNSFLVEECCEYTALLVDELIAPSPCGNEMYCFYEVVDEAGNSTIFEFFVTFTDTTPPSLSLNPDADWSDTYNADNVSDGDVLSFQCGELINFDETFVIATDLCSDAAVGISIEQIEDGVCPVDGYTSRWSIIWTATDECGYSTNFSVTALIIDEIAPVFDEAPVDLCGTLTLTQAEFDAFDPPTPEANDGACGVPVVEGPEVNQDACNEYSYTWTATDECENVGEFTVKVCIDITCIQNSAYCTLNDESYGDIWGSLNEQSTLQLVNQAVSTDPIVLGLPGKSYIISNPYCIIDMLPSNSNSSLPLPSGEKYFTNNNCGQLGNQLAAQTLTLTLNIRNNTGLRNLKLSNSCLTFNNKVYDHLGFEATVYDVLELANSALGSKVSGRLSFITRALEKINKAFLDCNDPCNETSRLITGDSVDDSNLQVYPSVTNGKLNITFDTKQSQLVNVYFYNQLGKLLKVNPLDGIVGENNHQLDISSFTPGMYFTVIHLSEDYHSFKILKSN